VHSINIQSSSMTMSPFRVDYAGEVIDLANPITIKKTPFDECTAESDVVEEVAKSETESETEVPYNDDEDANDNDVNDDANDDANAYHQHHHKISIPRSPNDSTVRTEVESLSASSSVSSLSKLPQACQEPSEPQQQQQQEQTETQTADTESSSTIPRDTLVSFSQIQIREYPMIVGDNPSILTGVPVTIDWEHVEEMEFQLEDYEAARVQPPRSMVELRMPASHRDAILKNQGFSLAERNQGKKWANITKHHRKRTSATMALSEVAEAVENAKRATKNATWGRKRKQQERKYLQPYHNNSEEEH